MNDNMHDCEVLKGTLEGPEEKDFTGASLAALLAQMACVFNKPKIEAVLIRPRPHRKRFPIPPRKI